MSEIDLHMSDLNPATAAVLGRFASRRRRLIWLRSIAIGLISLVVTMTAVAVCDYAWLLPPLVRALLSIAGYLISAAAVWWLALRSLGGNDQRLIAKQLESVDPRLREDLLSAVELASTEGANGSEGFRKRLQTVVARRTAGTDVRKLLPLNLLKPWLTTAAILLSIITALMLVPGIQLGRRIARVMLPGISIQRASVTKIQIISPDPNSGFVASGDAVGVVAKVSDLQVNSFAKLLSGDEIRLQYYSGEGAMKQVAMTARSISFDSIDEAASSVEPDTELIDDTAKEFAANVSIGTTPLTYRVVAGDAITLWHTLTPQPRPSVINFEKEYAFPAYSRLPNRIEIDEHGDLTALAGSKANVTVNFAEPVKDVVVNFGGRGVQFDMLSVEGSETVFRAQMPIKTTGQYQVLATSIRSGLSNPFSPIYSITPRIDTPPLVRWDPAIPRSQLVSPLDLLKLSATVSDDLPVERVFQEYEVNGDLENRKSILVETPDQDLDLHWQWDLIDPNHDPSSINSTDSIEGQADANQPPWFSNGDMVRTRVFALDRAGQRSESEFIELLIADEGFDSDRHARIDQLHDVLGQVSIWAMRTKATLDGADDTIRDDDPDKMTDLFDRLKLVEENANGLLASLGKQIAASTNLSEAGTLELFGRTVLHLQTEIRRLHGDLDQMRAFESETWNGQMAGHSVQLSRQAEQIDQHARAIFSHALTLGMVRDGILLHQSLAPLRSETKQVPIERFPRYFTAAIARLKAINDLHQRHADLLIDTTEKYLERWRDWTKRWTKRWTTHLEELERWDAMMDQKEVVRRIDLLRQRTQQFDGELTQQVRNSMLDNRIATALTESLRRSNLSLGWIHQWVTEVQRAGEAQVSTEKRAETGNDAKKSAVAKREAVFASGRRSRRYDQLIAKLDGEETLHRDRPSVHLQYAADMNLFGRAMRAVAGKGFVAVEDESASQVHEKLASAFRRIEAANQVEVLAREIGELSSDESRVMDSAESRIDHAVRLERFSAGLQNCVRELQRAGVPWDLIKAADATRFNADFNQARDRIIRRRWSGEPILGAESNLRKLYGDLQQTLTIIKPLIDEARETIRQYVLSIPELARQAAQEADEANRKISESDQGPADINGELDAAIETASETVEALIDLANTSSLNSQEERDLARDADSAAVQIQDAMKQVQTAKQSPAHSDQMFEKLTDLAKTLRETADHFERADQGEDLSASRERLRSGEQELNHDQELSERQAKSEAMANAAQKDPQELMEQLENELQRNELMQQELNEIAERTTEIVNTELQQLAREERKVNESFERSDPEMLERKIRAARAMRILVQQTQVIEQSLLGTVRQSNDWAKIGESESDLQSAREKLRQAVELSGKMGGENATFDQIQQTARQMAIAIKRAETRIESVRKVAEQAADTDVHNSDSRQKKMRQQAERSEANARRKNLDQIRREQTDWNREENAANQREKQFDRRSRDVQRQIEQFAERRKTEENEGKKQGIEDQISRLRRDLDEAGRAKLAAEGTATYADERGKQSQADRREIEKLRLEPLLKKNPAAQLSSRMAQQAKERLTNLRRQLGELSSEMSESDDFRANPRQSAELADRQERLANEVAEAAQSLRRAARHQDRLDDAPGSKSLETTADFIDQGAKVSAENATEDLQQASKSANESPQASRQIAQTQKDLMEAAAILTQQRSASKESDDQSDVSSGELSSDQKGAEQLAKTLDELDRAMASSSEASSEGRSMTAAEASPTLAASMDAMKQSAARQRSKSMQSGNGGSGEAGKPPEQADPPSEPGQPSDDSIAGDPPAGESVPINGVTRDGKDWGQLRSRQTDDANQSGTVRVPAEYRREIEAYFRAVARKAAEKQ